MLDEPQDAAVDAVRQSHTGKRLTEGQLSDAMSLAGIIRQHIHKTGSFIEPLADYAHAFARNEMFDAARGEMILRDVYTARYGESMNRTREVLLKREEALIREGREAGLPHARSIEGLIKEGETMPFYKAFDQAAVEMAREFGITESAAKKLMKQDLRDADDCDLYSWGKELESEHHRPVAEAARSKQRGAARDTPGRTRKIYDRRVPER